jgi:uncharacterized protein (UPF0332 family)
VTPEAERFIEKARQCLADAKLNETLVPRIAAREAYLAAFHAAEALVFERTRKIARTHRGLRSEFARLTRGDSSIDRIVSQFLGRGYELKSMADYGTGQESIVSERTASAAIKSAGEFIDLVSGLLDGANTSPNPPAPRPAS